LSLRQFCDCDVTAADTADAIDDADSDLDMPDDLLDPSDDEDRKRDTASTTTADDKVRAMIYRITQIQDMSYHVYCSIFNDNNFYFYFKLNETYSI